MNKFIKYPFIVLISSITLATLILAGVGIAFKFDLSHLKVEPFGGKAADGDWVNVRAFGAKGDGTTDDSTAIQSAIDALPSRGGIILFPTGTYKLLRGLIIKDSNTTFLGAGSSKQLGGSSSATTILSFEGEGTGQTGITSNGNFTMKDLDFVMASNTNNKAIDIGTYAYNTFENVSIVGVKRGITAGHTFIGVYLGTLSYGHNFKNTFIRGFDIGIEATSQDHELVITNNSEITGNKIGVRIGSGEEGPTVGGMIMGSGIEANSEFDLDLIQLKDFVISGNYFESTAGQGATKRNIRLGSEANKAVAGIIITGNYFNGNYSNKAASTADYAITMERAWYCIIEGNSFVDFAKGSVQVINTDLIKNKYGINHHQRCGNPTATTGFRIYYDESKSLIVQEDWANVSFQNSWANYGGNYATVQYFKDTLGIVHLKGVAKSGTMGATMFTLPSGYRPASAEAFSCSSYNGSTFVLGDLEIYTDGTVIPYAGSNVFFSLSGITFRAR